MLFFLACIYDIIHIMKRIFTILIIILMLTAGCASGEKPSVTGLVIDTQTVTSSPAPTLSAQTAEPSPSPLQDELTASAGQYTIAWISDTQYYSRSFPDIYFSMTEFLHENRERLNLKYIAHTGDLVNSADDEAQWAVAVKAMDTIKEIPGGVLAGNHDVFNGKADYSEYSRYFGEDRYAGEPWYGGSFKDNRGHFDLMDIGGTKYIFVYMGYIQTSQSIKWLNETFSAHPDRLGVLLLHDYLDTDSTLTSDGELLFEKVVKKNPNIRFVLCGHRYTLNNINAEIDDDGDGQPDRTVHQIIGNYQAAGDMGGSGFMRFFKVDEEEGKIYMYSYSPYLDEYVYFDEPERLEEKYATPPERETLVFDIDWL